MGGGGLQQAFIHLREARGFMDRWGVVVRSKGEAGGGGGAKGLEGA